MADDTKTAVATGKPANLVPVVDDSSFANLLDTAKFDHMWRVANTFANSTLVPKDFQQKPSDCFIAVQMAVRLQVDPFMFMQNVYMAPGNKPAFYGQFAIALANSRGPFKGPIMFDEIGTKGQDSHGVTAWAIHKTTGERCEITVTIATAKAEGWYTRNTKWKTIPEMMLRYRAGAWLARLYAPEALMGLPTVEEVEDMKDITPGAPEPPKPPQPPRPTRKPAAAATVVEGTATVVDPAPEPAGEQAQASAADPEPEKPRGFEVINAWGEQVFVGDLGMAAETLFSELARCNSPEEVQMLTENCAFLIHNMPKQMHSAWLEAARLRVEQLTPKPAEPEMPTVVQDPAVPDEVVEFRVIMLDGYTFTTDTQAEAMEKLIGELEKAASEQAIDTLIAKNKALLAVMPDAMMEAWGKTVDAAMKRLAPPQKPKADPKPKAEDKPKAAADQAPAGKRTYSNPDELKVPMVYVEGSRDRNWNAWFAACAALLQGLDEVTARTIEDFKFANRYTISDLGVANQAHHGQFMAKLPTYITRNAA